MRKTGRVGLRGNVGDNHQFTARQRLAHRVAVRQRHRRVGAHYPDGFHLATPDGLEEFHGHQAGRLRDALAAPEPPETGDACRIKTHMARELISQPAHFTTAHRVRLTGQRKRPATGPPDVSARQMHVNDGVALVAAAGGLINAHGVERHRRGRVQKPVVKARHFGFWQPTELRHARHAPFPCGRERLRLAVERLRREQF